LEECSRTLEGGMTKYMADRRVALGDGIKGSGTAAKDTWGRKNKNEIFRKKQLQSTVSGLRARKRHRENGTQMGR